jgi:hypothetical protein
MSSLKALLACGLAAVVLAGCATTVKTPQGRGKVDNPRTNNPDYLKCIRDHGFQAVEVGATTIQVGQPPAGPTVRFLPTPGSATAAQIYGQAQGAEVIGAALLYPNQAQSRELGAIEVCLNQKVKG